MPNSPGGFQFHVVGGDIVITHHGRRASTLRGSAAARFPGDFQSDDPQELMARVTGHYQHGNERTAKNHPRNRRRRG